MPEFQLTNSIITSLNAQEPWPDNVKLFQPYEVEQILLPDNASCLAVQAFLKMCNLPFEVEMRWNAEFMSPSGRVPFIKCGAFVVSELEPIVQFAANKGVTLCGKLSLDEKAEMRAYMSLITNVLVNAELYISWIDDDTYNAVTKVRNSSVYPWPLGWLQTRSKRNAVAKRLRALHWGDKTLDQVLADVDQCCNTLSQRLGERDYFFGTIPTPLDALVYGHMRALLSANGPKSTLFIKPMTTSLLKFVVRISALTGMKMTPQEEYLLTQAFQFTRRRLSLERTASDRSTHIKRSKLCIRNTSIDNFNVNYGQDLFGFKPFSCKQIKLTTTKDGAVTCNYNDKRYTAFDMQENYNFAVEIIEDILDKVDETAFVDLNIKLDDKNDFEIVYPNDEKCGNITVMNEFLDTIEENDVTDTTVSLDMAEDLIQIVNDDDTDDNDVINDEIMDSDGLVNDKLLEEAVLDNSNVNSDVTDSSKAMKGVYLTYSGSRISKQSDILKSDAPKSDALLTPVSRSSSRVSQKSVKSDTLKSEPRTPLSSGSKMTLKFPSDEEISVESLLKYLRERNATYGHYGSYVEVADID